MDIDSSEKIHVEITLYKEDIKALKKGEKISGHNSRAVVDIYVVLDCDCDGDDDDE